MTLTESRKTQEFESVLPLINVIFLLLIFLIIGGIFTQPELLDVHPPESISDRQSPDEAIQILLDREGELSHEGKIISMYRFQQIMEQASVNDPDMPIQVKADHKVAMQKVFEVMEIIKHAGHDNFQLFTLKI